MILHIQVSYPLSQWLSHSRYSVLTCYVMIHQEWMNKWKAQFWEEKWEFRRQKRRGTDWCRSPWEKRKWRESLKLPQPPREGRSLFPLQGRRSESVALLFCLPFPSWGSTVAPMALLLLLATLLSAGAWRSGLLKGGYLQGQQNTQIHNGMLFLWRVC